MVKKASKARSRKRSSARSIDPDVVEFLKLVRKNTGIKRRFKAAPRISLLSLARGFGYTFTRAELRDGINALVPAKEHLGDPPHTCTWVD